jgi:NTP pyrophosphatase (non-canonical NTP hydrolase)
VEIRELVRRILRFRDARDWGQFHSPKNLAAALSVEVAELQELMLWKSDFQTLELVHSEKGSKRFEEEIADILIYALLLAYEVGIDPGDAIRKKLIQNAAKYPVSLARGNAIKYSELRDERASSRQTENQEEDLAETDAMVQVQIALFPEAVSHVN